MGETVSEPNHVLVVLAVSAVVAWVAAAAALSVARQPRRIRPGPPVLDLPGRETPAVVNLLAHDFEVTPDAVPATVLDFAARRIVDIELLGGHNVVRMRGRVPDDLSPYEQAVYLHLTSRAEGNIVPAAALTTGPREASSRWWRQFRKHVIADAQQRGLCRAKWPAPIVGALGALALLPFGLSWLASSVGTTEVPEGDESAWSYIVLGCYLASFGVIFLSGALGASLRQRDTDAGRAAASRWLGLKEKLAENEVFAEQPPSAVAIWDRLLAFGAALGVAAGAVRGLPMGAEDDNNAWSSFGGEWHQVKIRYPRLPPARGRHPAGATALGLFWGGLAFSAILQLPLLVAPLAALVLLWSAMVLVRSIPDLFVTRQIHGEVLRLRHKPKLSFARSSEQQPRRYFVAVDPGGVKKIQAWTVRRALYQQLRQYEEVVATVTPALPYVRSVERRDAG